MIDPLADPIGAIRSRWCRPNWRTLDWLWPVKAARPGHPGDSPDMLALRQAVDDIHLLMDKLDEEWETNCKQSERIASLEIALDALRSDGVPT